MRLHLLPLLVALALPSFAKANDDRPIGVVGLRTDSLSRAVRAMVNEQLQATLETISHRRVVPVVLGEGLHADDIDALRSASMFGDLHAVVGGVVTSVDDPGGITLFWVPSDGAPVRAVSRAVPGNAESAQRAAVDSAACGVVGDDGDTMTCQVPLELVGNEREAELEVDGRRVMRVNDVTGVSLDVGSHFARGCLGDDCSTKRRLDLVRNSSLTLRIQSDCNRIHLLGVKEAPDCGGTAHSDVIPLFVESNPTNWKAVAVLAVGGAAVVAGVIFGLQASAAKGKLDDAKGDLSRDAMRSHVADFNSNRTLATASLITGGVVGAAGGVMLAFDF